VPVHVLSSALYEQAALKGKDPEAKIFFAPTSLRAGGFWLPELAKEIAEATVVRRATPSSCREKALPILGRGSEAKNTLY
jgi:hypothetical protein